MRKSAERAVRAYVEHRMSKRVRKLVNAARWDLNFGPHSRADFHAEGIAWPGYSSACEIVQAWIDERMPGELWVNTQTDDVLETEPEGYTDEETGENVEPAWEDFIHYDGRDIKRIVFGPLVGNGID